MNRITIFCDILKMYSLSENVFMHHQDLCKKVTINFVCLRALSIWQNWPAGPVGFEC